MKTKSAIHGARAAADIKEAAKTAANSRSTQASKQASAHAATVGVQYFYLFNLKGGVCTVTNVRRGYIKNATIITIAYIQSTPLELR